MTLPRLRTRLIWLLGLVLLGSASAQQLALNEIWRLSEGLDRPESVVYDAVRERLYVSNIVGDVSAKDGNGYIATVSPAGELLEPAWFTGLNAPKGLALLEATLYVADLDALVAIDVTRASEIARYEVASDSFLNDVTADAEGRVYVSDSQKSIIYRLADGQFSPWFEDENMLSPNGLYAMPDALVVAASDASAVQPYAARYLQTVDYNTLERRQLSDGSSMGALDGIEPDGEGGYLLSDWGSGLMLYFSRETGVTLLDFLDQGAADFVYVIEQNRLYLPMMFTDEMIAFELVR